MTDRMETRMSLSDLGIFWKELPKNYMCIVFVLLKARTLHSFWSLLPNLTKCASHSLPFTSISCHVSPPQVTSFLPHNFANILYQVTSPLMVSRHFSPCKVITVNQPFVQFVHKCFVLMAHADSPPGTARHSRRGTVVGYMSLSRTKNTKVRLFIFVKGFSIA